VAPRIKLGSSLTVGKDAWLNVLPEATDDVNIVIEDHCRIGARCVISAKNQIHLERHVSLAPAILIQDHNHAYEDTDRPIRVQGTTPGGRIRIEQGCCIGQGTAIVCPRGELVVGRGSVVAPNSLIVRSFPPYSVIEGNPARVVGQIAPQPNVVSKSARSEHVEVLSSSTLVPRH
jgi:acetyltransferase-like isoleucine patch superfamily enzyme